MPESIQPVAFISYARADDKRGHVTRFREHLSDEVQVLIGREFPIFQDSVHIHWGEDWKDETRGNCGLFHHSAPRDNESLLVAEG